MAHDMIQGCVEIVSNKVVSGWCFKPESSEPCVVKLYVNDIFIRARRADIERKDQERSGKLLSGFSFPIDSSLLKKLPEKSEVRVVAGDNETVLPVLENIKNCVEGRATDGGAELREMLATVWHVDHWGALHISFGKKPELKKQLIDLYCGLRTFFKAQEGIDLYLTGGNLLGIIREFDFLDHDDDIDTSFCVHAAGPEEAADKFFTIFDRITPKLLALGYGVGLVNVCQFHIYKAGAGTLDVFMGWLTPTKEWYRWTGAGGYLGVNTFNVREIEYLGQRVFIPQYAERELDLTYGDNWKERDHYYSKSRPPHIKVVMERLLHVASDRLTRRREVLKSTSGNPMKAVREYQDMLSSC